MGDFWLQVENILLPGNKQFFVTKYLMFDIGQLVTSDRNWYRHKTIPCKKH